MKISQTVTELWGVQEFFWGKMGKNNQRGINWKQRKGEKPSLYVTHRLYLIYIPIKFHEDIPNGNRVIGITRMNITQNKKNQRAITQKRKNGK